MPYDQYDSAANITFSINENEIPISGLDTSKDVEIEEIRANHLKPIGYSITEIAYSGTMTFEGNSVIKGADVDEDNLDEFFMNDDGTPVVGAQITIYHENDDQRTSYENVMVVSEGYETDTGEVSGITYEWISSDRERAGVN